MFRPRFLRRTTEERTGAERRTAGRMRCEGLHCDHGPVLDASSNGVRVKIVGKAGPEVGEIVDIEMLSEDLEFKAHAEVMWVHKGQFGARFPSMDDITRRTLWNLIQNHRPEDADRTLGAA